MLTRHQHTSGHVFGLTDVTAVGAWLASYWVRFHVPTAFHVLATPRSIAASSAISHGLELKPLTMSSWKGFIDKHAY
jgi:hypothetical protein